MNAPTHRRLLWLGLALIAGVNAIALGGVAFNRSAVESRLVLGERELHMPFRYGDDREDSGVALAVDWQVAPGDGQPRMPGYSFFGGYGINASPAWLDDAKLSLLDLATARPANDATRAPRERERAAVLVLELDGPAYRKYVAQAQAEVVAARAKAQGAAVDSAAHNALESAERELRRAEGRASRLFVVDAGLDAVALRTRYPDRSRYALLQGIVGAGWLRDADQHWRLVGHVERLLVPQVQLSHPQVQALGTALRPTTGYEDEPQLPLRAQLAIGRRLEPWVEAIGPR